MIKELLSKMSAGGSVAQTPQGLRKLLDSAVDLFQAEMWKNIEEKKEVTK